MTTTAVMNGTSIGTGSNIGSPFNPTKTALQAATSGVFVSVQLTLAATQGGNVSSRVRLWQATSPISYATALAGAQALASGAEYTELKLDSLGTVVIERKSDIILTASGYHYCWLEVPLLNQAATVIVNLMELP